LRNFKDAKDKTPLKLEKDLYTPILKRAEKIILI
jgi:hypothetical protein